jgi:hypothetical protein
MLDGVSAETGGWESASSNWVFGSIRGMEANFGSDAGTCYEKSMPCGSNLYGNTTVGQEDITFPVPQRQIDLSSGNIVQNR